jgi:hypothetical protein
MCRKILIAIFMFSSLYSQYNRPGSADGQFLKIGVSPRAVAMADAYISLADGAEATYYNQAALARVPGIDITFNHNFWFAGINHNFIAASVNLNKIGTIAASINALYTDQMEVRTPLRPDGTGETFYAYNYKIALSYSRYFTDRVTFGVSLGYIFSSLYKNFIAKAITFDFAAMYTSDFRNFKFAMQISNFGSELKYVNESYPLPTSFNFGASMDLIENNTYKLVASITGQKPNTGQPLLFSGLEAGFKNAFFIRTGYKFNHGVADYSLGVGTKWKVNKYDFKFDYSFSHYKILGSAHMIGVGISIK